MRVELIPVEEGSLAVCHHDDGSRTVVGEGRGMIFEFYQTAADVKRWNYARGAAKGVATRRASRAALPESGADTTGGTNG